MAEQKHKVLIVEHDAYIARFLEINLNKFGYETRLLTKTEDALETANTWRPSVILCELASQPMDGIEFCWMIREKSEIPLVPFILLTGDRDMETRINGYRSGADAFIRKPLSLRSLLTRIEALLWRIESIRSHYEKSAKDHPPQEQTVFSGSLQHFPLLEILQFANMSKKTGTLLLQHGDEQGTVIIDRGEIRYAKAGDVEGEAAAYRMGVWKEGRFSLSPEIDPELSNIKKPTMKLILDCFSVLDMENIVVNYDNEEDDKKN